MSKTIVIVDAYSSGSSFCNVFKKYGVQSIHIQSNRNIAPYMLSSFKPNDFIEKLIYENNAEQLIEQIRKYNIIGVVPGAETGVLLADQLSEGLKLTANGIEKSKARRNKFEMIKILKESGLNVPKQIQSDNLSEIVGWVDDNNLWPFVMKPVDSAGTDNVSICANEADVCLALNKIKVSTNICGEKNRYALCQSLIEGTEYCVDTVSYDGKTYVTDILQYKKNKINNAHFVYEYADLLPYHGVIQKELMSFNESLLQALDIKYGPAHSEIYYTKTGPVCVEVAARPIGAGLPLLISKATEHNQIDLTADIYCGAKLFKQIYNAAYNMKYHLRLVFMISSKNGFLKNHHQYQQLKELTSFVELIPFVKPGSKLSITTNLLTSPGIILLLHSEKNKIEEDYAAIREMELNFLYPTEEERV